MVKIRPKVCELVDEESRVFYLLIFARSLDDKELPAVPSLLIRIPPDYPHSSPQFDTKNYGKWKTGLLQWLKNINTQRLTS